jgi:hypothetical protein
MRLDPREEWGLGEKGIQSMTLVATCLSIGFQGWICDSRKVLVL